MYCVAAAVLNRSKLTLLSNSKLVRVSSNSVNVVSQQSSESKDFSVGLHLVVLRSMTTYRRCCNGQMLFVCYAQMDTFFMLAKVQIAHRTRCDKGVKQCEYQDDELPHEDKFNQYL